ncbi:MAG: hypothetical protein IJP61_02420 [Treponema sp.]|nr:hypothetical protein [Treponema sp.]
MSDDAWYSYDGPESDVVLSTRIRLARNLANFPFPSCFKDDDAIRVQTLIFDSFAHSSSPDSYQGIEVSKLDELGTQILVERGVLDQNTKNISGSGVIVRTDGKFSCTVNEVDHVRFASFAPGLEIEDTYRTVAQIDNELQNSVQFAADYEHGFLTSAIKDSGSGMKISFRLHLPSLSMSAKMQNIFMNLDQSGFSMSDCFGSGQEKFSSLGFYYQVSTRTAASGNEASQMASILSIIRQLIDFERSERELLSKKRISEIRDYVFKNFAKAKFATFLTLREAIEIISAVKFGIGIKILEGITDKELCALLYRIQNGHLQFVMKSKHFNFPADIAENKTLKENHLRTLVIQESFGNLKIAL